MVYLKIKNFNVYRYMIGRTDHIPVWLSAETFGKMGDIMYEGSAVLFCDIQ